MSDLISIVTPVYNTSSEFLMKAYSSIRAQTYLNWEWCIANDGSTMDETNTSFDFISKDPNVKSIKCETNGGIGSATIAAASLAMGKYIAFMDDDDMLDKDALKESLSLMEAGQYDLVYSDEDLIDTEDHLLGIPHYKPDNSLHYLESNNYMCHFVMVKKEFYDSIGGVALGYDGAQDHEFLLRASERTYKIGHLKKVLYHWRHHNSFSRAPETQDKLSAVALKALKEHLARRGYESECFTQNDSGTGNKRLIYYHKKPMSAQEKVDIIIAFKDDIDKLHRCVSTIQSMTKSFLYKLCIVYTNKQQVGSFFNRYPQYKAQDIKWIHYNSVQFNMAHAYNLGIQATTNNHICVMHDGIVITSTDWLEQLLTYSLESDVGCVSGKVVNKETGCIVHAGAYTHYDGIVRSYFSGRKENIDFMNRGYAVQNVSAVFNMIMMFKRVDYNSVNGFDENYTLYHSDIDFCFRIATMNKKHVYIPICKFYYTQGNARQRSYTKEDFAKLSANDNTLFTETYAAKIQHPDPYVNPALFFIHNNMIITPENTAKRILAKPIVNKEAKLVSFIIPWYNDVPTTLMSLLAQTHQAIECIVVHDGPPTEKARKLIEALGDSRVTLVNTPAANKDWGHTPRNFGIDYVKNNSSYIVFAGMDNYYYPTYTKELLETFPNDTAVAAYCNFYYNGYNWNVMTTQLALGNIDCGCFMVRTDIAKHLRWQGTHYEADWAFIKSVINAHGISQIYKLQRALFIHN